MTAKPDSTANTTPSLGLDDFSLVVGGPLFRLYRRSHLSGSELEHLVRRITVILLIAWLPLLILSIVSGQAIGGGIKIPFLYDIEAHVRFLVALPVLLAADLVVHRRLSPVISRFVQRCIVTGEDLPKLSAAVTSTLRARNSAILEVVLLVLVYSLGIWFWRTQLALHEPTWYATTDGTNQQLTLAGHWYGFVSIPIFQFILLRWYIRIALWFRLLWKVSRLNLHLAAIHPDNAGGLGFLGKSSYAFGPLLFAEGAMLSGLIASRVLYEGQRLLAFKMEAVGLVSLLLLVILGPLVMFSIHLLRAKRKGSSEFGLLSTQYVHRFQEKWLRGHVDGTEIMLGSSDIQSLADLSNNYSTVSNMRIVPFGVKDITWLAAVTAAPLLPLTLTIFSLEEVLNRLIKVIL